MGTKGPYQTFEESTNNTFKEMAMGAILREGQRAPAGSWVLIDDDTVIEAEEYNKRMSTSNQFDVGTMLAHVKSGQKCRRASWKPGMFVYRAADDSSTLRRKESPEALSAVYHPTPDLFATDWELLIETCSLGEAIEHLRAGGTVRRLSWLDQSGRTFLKANAGEVQIHFPGGTKDGWKPYCREVLATDWIKIKS